MGASGSVAKSKVAAVPLEPVAVVKESRNSEEAVAQQQQQQVKRVEDTKGGAVAAGSTKAGAGGGDGGGDVRAKDQGAVTARSSASDGASSASEAGPACEDAGSASHAGSASDAGSASHAGSASDAGSTVSDDEGAGPVNEALDHFDTNAGTRRVTYCEHRRQKLSPQSAMERLQKILQEAAVYKPRCVDLDEFSQQYVKILPRGGHWCKLGESTIQFGVPPETIKDSMQLGLDVPRFYVVLGDLFSRSRGLNFAELEFPAYFNFFVRRKRTVVLTTARIEARIRALFQETLMGPAPGLLDLASDHKEGLTPDYWPNFKLEGEYLDAARKTLSVDSLLEFRRFRTVEKDMHGHSKLQRCTLEEEDITVEYRLDGARYEVSAGCLGSGRDTAAADTAAADTAAAEPAAEPAEPAEPAAAAADTTSSSSSSSSPAESSDDSSCLPREANKLYIYMEDIVRWLEQPPGMRAKPEAGAAPARPPKVLKDIPKFGVTMLGTSHGFDANGQTTGFVLWKNRRGTMVDPPPNAIECLEELKISSRLIDSVILTHCHSDHDAGAFRRLLLDRHITIYTTSTIFNSFVRKYSAITGLSTEFLHELLVMRQVKVGSPTYIHGCKLEFRYSLHTIPCMGFTATLCGKTISYSADTHNSVELFEKMHSDGVLGKGRFESLVNFPWHSDLVLHEAGVPPIHTPLASLTSLPDELKQRMYVVHVARKDVPEDCGLRTLEQGDTVAVPVENKDMEVIEILDVLSTIDIFQPACHTFKNASEMLYIMETEVFKSGDRIVKQGDPGDKCFIITKGAARVSWKDPEGNEQSKLFRVGDYFGESSLVTGEPRNADIFAEGDVRAATISSEHFNNIAMGTSLKADLTALASIRKRDSWQILNQNSILRGLSSTAKTTLEFSMEERQFNAGEIIWEVDSSPNFVFLIKSGRFHVKVDDAYLRERRTAISVSIDKGTGLMKVRSTRRAGSAINVQPVSLMEAHALGDDDGDDDGADSINVRKTEGVLSTGGLVGDFDAIFANKPVASTVVCLEAGSALVIEGAKWKQFCARFPGGLLFFMEQQLIDVQRDLSADRTTTE